MRYPSDLEARRDILDAGRRLYARGLVAANDGNLSARVSPTELWATPANVSKGDMSEDMLVKLTLGGAVIAGTRAPSSELLLHLAVYRRSPEVLSVVHAHPPYATARAARGLALDRLLLAESETLLGVIPLAPYAPPGSDALAEGAAAFCPAYKGVLLERHGAVTWGGSVTDALFRMERLEHTAHIEYLAGNIGE
ncbi:MAG: class II aldolase/adducin family protein [Oscillospiraceae bacterium]|nr:class II aldolase/adducin family protein [Oscillospiraceae bacterium]